MRDGKRQGEVFWAEGVFWLARPGRGKRGFYKKLLPAKKPPRAGRWQSPAEWDIAGKKRMGRMDGRISYSPLILKSMNEITTYFGVGKETVYRWIEEGAPIAVENARGAPRYSCEAAQLQQWRIGKCRKHP